MLKLAMFAAATLGFSTYLPAQTAPIPERTFVGFGKDPISLNGGDIVWERCPDESPCYPQHYSSEDGTVIDLSNSEGFHLYNPIKMGAERIIYEAVRSSPSPRTWAIFVYNLVERSLTKLYESQNDFGAIVANDHLNAIAFSELMGGSRQARLIELDLGTVPRTINSDYQATIGISDQGWIFGWTFFSAPSNEIRVYDLEGNILDSIATDSYLRSKIVKPTGELVWSSSIGPDGTAASSRGDVFYRNPETGLVSQITDSEYSNEVMSLTLSGQIFYWERDKHLFNIFFKHNLATANTEQINQKSNQGSRFGLGTNELGDAWFLGDLPAGIWSSNQAGSHVSNLYYYNGDTGETVQITDETNFATCQASLSDDGVLAFYIAGVESNGAAVVGSNGCGGGNVDGTIYFIKTDDL